MLSLGRWKFGLLGAIALTGGCNLGDLLDEEALLDKFKGIEIPAAGIEEVQKRIGEAGGQAVTSNAAVNIPEGALSEDVDIEVAPADTTALVAELPSVLKPISAPVSFKPDGTKFDEPVTLSLFYDKGAQPQEPAVVWLENEKDTEWKTVPAEDTSVEPGVAYVSTKHFSIYAVVDCQAAGPLAGLCRKILSGEISIKEALQMAPPVDDTWGGVVKPGDDTGPDTNGGTYDCRSCLEIAQQCQKDPRQDICQQAADPCMKLAPSCFEDEPPTRCEDLGRRCQGGEQAACDAMERECGSVQPPCDDLERKCEAGDTRACADFDKAGCTSSGSECEDALRLCEGGNTDACAFYEGYCGDPVDECTLAELDCGRGDVNACEFYNTYCADALDEDCQRASDMCEGGDSHACELFQFYCIEGNPQTDECQGASDACYVGNTDACEYYEFYCAGPSACDKLYTDCYVYEIVDACYTYEAECTSQPSDCDLARDDCEINQIQEACDYYQYYCVDVGPDCGQLDYDCHVSEIPQACADFEAYCAPDGGVGNCHYETYCDEICDGQVCWQECYETQVCDPIDPPPPPPQECMNYYDACMRGDDVACQSFSELGCPPPPDGEPADAGVPPPPPPAP